MRDRRCNGAWFDNSVWGLNALVAPAFSNLIKSRHQPQHHGTRFLFYFGLQWSSVSVLTAGRLHTFKMATPASRADQKNPYRIAQDSEMDMSYHSLMYEDGAQAQQWEQQQWQQQQQQQHGRYQPSQTFYGPGVPNWPDGAATLRRSNMFATCAIMIDGILICIALLFLVLAIAAVSVRNRPAGDGLGTLIEQAMKLVNGPHNSVFKGVLT